MPQARSAGSYATKRAKDLATRGAPHGDATPRRARWSRRLYARRTRSTGGRAPRRTRRLRNDASRNVRHKEPSAAAPLPKSASALGQAVWPVVTLPLQNLRQKTKSRAAVSRRSRRLTPLHDTTFGGLRVLRGDSFVFFVARFLRVLRGGSLRDLRGGSSAIFVASP